MLRLNGGTVSQSSSLDILISIFMVSVAGLIIFDVLLFLRLPFFQEAQEHHKEPVSVIICAKNEAENLRVILPLLHEQDYDHFEVIVIDDASTDGTLGVIKEYAKLFPQLHYKNINIDDKEANRPGKKTALAMGIAMAKFDIMLLTDVMCFPAA